MKGLATSELSVVIHLPHTSLQSFCANLFTLLSALDLLIYLIFNLIFDLLFWCICARPCVCVCVCCYMTTSQQGCIKCVSLRLRPFALGSRHGSVTGEWAWLAGRILRCVAAAAPVGRRRGAGRADERVAMEHTEIFLYIFAVSLYTFTVLTISWIYGHGTPTDISNYGL